MAASRQKRQRWACRISAASSMKLLSGRFRQIVYMAPQIIFDKPPYKVA